MSVTAKRFVIVNENISSTKTLEAKASTSAKTSANAKTSIKGGGKTNLRTF